MTTAEQKHTRGPWQVDREYDVTVIRPTQPREGNVNRPTVARIPDLSVPFDESYANSLLIAAAPEMAQALRHAYRVINSSDELQEHPIAQDALQHIEAALQKAGLQ